MGAPSLSRMARVPQVMRKLVLRLQCGGCGGAEFRALVVPERVLAGLKLEHDAARLVQLKCLRCGRATTINEAGCIEGRPGELLPPPKGA